MMCKGDTVTTALGWSADDSGSAGFVKEIPDSAPSNVAQGGHPCCHSRTFLDVHPRKTMKRLRFAVFPTVLLFLLFPLRSNAAYKEVTVQPGVSTETVLAFSLSGCTPVNPTNGTITVQPKHGTVVVVGGSYTTPGCPNVQFPGVQANYTWTDTTGQPGSGSDIFHVRFSSAVGTVDYDILISVGFSGKVLGSQHQGLPSGTSTPPLCPCSPTDPSQTIGNTGAVVAGGSVAADSGNNSAASAWRSIAATGSGDTRAVAARGAISANSGNVFYQVTDYQTAGPNPLAFARYYNSGASVTSFARALGPNWRSNYDGYINSLPSSTVATVERPSGQVLGFFNNGSAWITDTDVDYKLVHSGTTWTLTDPDDTVETYSEVILGTLATNESLLTSIKARNGYTQTLHYNGFNQLASVTDSYGRTLTFTYNSDGTLSTMTTPDNNNFVYAYNSNKTLAWIASPVDVNGGYTYSYFYENAALPNALTGVSDKYGERNDTWTYDASGRGLTSHQGTGADLTTVAYNADGTTTVTNALGVTDTYTFTTLQFVPKVTQVSRAATSNTAAATRTFTYDADGYMASTTDWNGNKTTYVNNAHGAPTTINEAVGTSAARTTTISYDPAFVHLPHQIVTTGLTTTFAYDTSGNLHTRTDTDTTTQTVPYSTHGQTRTWTFTYNNFLLASVQSPRTDVTSITNFGYDSTGALASITDALGHVTRITAHTGGGYPQTIVDPNNVTTTLGYDGQMRLTTRTVNTSTGALTTQYNYWFGDLLFNVTLPDRSLLNSSPDTALRPLNFVDNYGNTVTFTLDALGDATQVNITDPGNNLKRQHSATFDSLGRMLTDVGGVGQTTTYSYDNNGNALTIKDPLNHTTTQVFDALNRVAKSTDANGGVTTISYDVHNRPLTVADPNGNITSYVYDGFGGVIQQTSPDSGTTVYHYDAGRNLTSKTDAASVVTNYTYDKLDRVLTTTYPADSTLNIAFTYDQSGTGFGFGIGRLTSVTDAAGSLSRSYDERGNLLTEKRVNGGNTLTTAYTYDKASRVSSITYPSGATVTYTRDDAGKVVAVPFSATGADAQFVGWFAHLPFGPVNSINYNNGDLARFGFDADYRLTTLAYNTYQSVPYFKWTYNYDAANNVSSITDSITSANNQTFGYDLLNRLTSASSTGTYGNLTWSYDKNGNLLSKLAGGTTFNYTYTIGTNRLATSTWPGNSESFAYTATGNLSTAAINGANVFTGTYNKANRLASVSGVPLAITGAVYDAFGRRITKANSGSNPILYTYDLDGKLIEENNNGTITDYIYVDGINIANWAPGQKHLYMINFDRLGTPLVSRDEFGLTNWAAYSQPYGAMTQTVTTGQFTGPVTQNLRLPGQNFDHEDSLHYNGFRDYMPSLGRYLEADPTGLAGGLNEYSYALANPLGLMDPEGLEVTLPFIPFSPRNQSLYRYQYFYDEPGVFSVEGHGNSQHLWDGQKFLSPEELARRIFNDPRYWPGMTIRLIACNTGAGENSYAQQLADAIARLAELTGRRASSSSLVYAPDGFVVIDDSLFGGVNARIVKADGSPGQYLPFIPNDVYKDR